MLGNVVELDIDLMSSSMFHLKHHQIMNEPKTPPTSGKIPCMSTAQFQKNELGIDAIHNDDTTMLQLTLLQSKTKYRKSISTAEPVSVQEQCQIEYQKQVQEIASMLMSRCRFDATTCNASIY